MNWYMTNSLQKVYTRFWNNICVVYNFIISIQYDSLHYRILESLKLRTVKRGVRLPELCIIAKLQKMNPFA